MMMKMEALLLLGHRKDLSLRLSSPTKPPSCPSPANATHVTDSFAFKTINDGDEGKEKQLCIAEKKAAKRK